MVIYHVNAQCIRKQRGRGVVGIAWRLIMLPVKDDLFRARNTGVCAMCAPSDGDGEQNPHDGAVIMKNRA